ncbi:MAG: hypothetical protein V7608_831 [Hyphomicrobiales bacterium]|jgi:hypothetical protein
MGLLDPILGTFNSGQIGGFASGDMLRAFSTPVERGDHAVHERLGNNGEHGARMRCDADLRSTMFAGTANPGLRCAPSGLRLLRTFRGLTQSRHFRSELDSTNFCHSDRASLW